MRLHLQRCLILWLCFFSGAAFAYYPALPEGGAVYWEDHGSKYYIGDDSGDPPSTNYIQQAQAQMPGCQSAHEPEFVCSIQSYDDDPKYLYDYFPGEGYYEWTGGARVIYAPQGCEGLSHEPDPETGQAPSTCECTAPWVQSGAGAPYACMLPDEPEECYENGQVHNPATGLCELECEHGQLNGACLPPPEEPSECNSDSSDYRGQIVQGYGKTPINFCGDIDQCSGGKPGQIGLVNGELRCIAQDYGVPQCQGDSISVIDDYGFVCEPLTNQPEEPETPEDPNTDTDGDGEPDEYQRENDPESIEKGLDKIENAIKDGNAKTDKSNQHLGNIENAVKSIANDVSSLEQMGKNGELSGGGGGASGGGEGLKNAQGEDYLGDLADIKENTRNTADGIDDLNEKLDDPENGYATDELEGAVPTFEQSSDRLYNAIISNPTIQAVTTIPELASNNTCPVYTMPSTDYWPAMTIDIHCVILNEHRGTLSTVFLIVWTLTAIMVFLRA